MGKMLNKGKVNEMKEQERRCRMCGDKCWRNDVCYCWDCYKYEMFESR